MRQAFREVGVFLSLQPWEIRNGVVVIVLARAGVVPFTIELVGAAMDIGLTFPTIYAFSARNIQPGHRRSLLPVAGGEGMETYMR